MARVCVVVQQALTHPSFRMNYGTNADHARNSLTNCGKRQLEYGDKRIHFIHTRKRGRTPVTVVLVFSLSVTQSELPNSTATSRLIVNWSGSMMMSGYDFLKSEVFRCWPEVDSDKLCLVMSGKILFVLYLFYCSSYFSRSWAVTVGSETNYLRPSVVNAN